MSREACSAARKYKGSPSGSGRSPAWLLPHRAEQHTEHVNSVVGLDQQMQVDWMWHQRGRAPSASAPESTATVAAPL